MTLRAIFLIASLLPVSALLGCGSIVFAQNRYDECPEGTVESMLDQKQWNVAYTGYGRVDFEVKDGKKAVNMEPALARSPQSTHASLVLSKFKLPADSFDLHIQFMNDKPVRGPAAANPWETFWLMFQYQPQAKGQKTTNYIAAKPNGIELGTAFGDVGQTFLRTV